MQPSEFKSLLLKTIPAKLPVLVKGAPGIGKSDIVRQAASELEVNLEVSHPVVDDPTDYKGMPAIVRDDDKTRAEFLPFGNLERLINAEERTVAFIDDLGQAPKVVQAAVMQLILGRQVNGKKISDEIVFVAATNERHHKAGVTGILEPVKSRFATIVPLEVNVDDWCKWAYDNDVPPEIIGFIRFRPELLIDEENPTNDIVNRHSPRTVANAGRLYKEGIADYEALAGAAGEGWATEFTGYLDVWKELPSIDSILLDPEEAKVPDSPGALYAISAGVVSRVSEKNSKQVHDYAMRLPEEFQVLVMRDTLRKMPELANNKHFIEWATDNQDIFE